MKTLYYYLLFIISIFTIFISCSSDDNGATNPETQTDEITFNIDENPLNNLELGYINIDSENINFTIIDQTPFGTPIGIQSNGLLYVRDSILYNYEINPIIQATVNTFKQNTNGGNNEIVLIKKTTVTIVLNDVYEKYSHIGNITLFDQEDVNAFGTENPWGVSGTLSIQGGDIIDFSPISEIIAVGSLVLKNFEHPIPDMNFIQEIKEDLIIEDNPGIENLEWLPNFNILEDDLKIINNGQLTSILGLPSQLTIEDDVIIEDNSSLESLNGFQNISTINGSLKILNNDQIVSLVGFSNQLNITGDVFIDGNYSLESLNGLQNIIAFNNDLKIKNNTNLTDITALSGVSIIGGGLQISANNFLENISGLENLIEVNGSFHLSSHAFITNLDVFSNLQLVTGTLSINVNPSLYDFCGITNLITNGSIGGYYVENNQYNPTQQDILDGYCN